ncbi:hypothetical protein CW731_08185 [Polaribacter sp. ALD11]|uniref:hypothetical protein n=1 Tax=Polaribacter sp. ALD11 TaxID=2058137 RepID=UPI000C306E3F|nr:hypothetical protein [Polaribacter sp. ALD11]AUC85268.1 hypothetical protein CW731_08185 [Polaribacter sp. ALD11]
MKPFISIFCFLLIISCNPIDTKPQKPSFILGKWIRTNDKPGNKTYETWNNSFTGLGITLKEKDTIFKERLSIISINDTLNLKVEGANETPTLFKFTQQTDTSFVCENAKNEFPKKITYFLEDEKLKAIVSNSDFKIDFVFERLN